MEGVIEVPKLTPGLNNNQNNGNDTGSSNNTNTNSNSCKINITPAQALVIGGLLTGVFDIYSFQIDIYQNIEITLLGTFKQEESNKPDTDSLLESLNSVPLDVVLKSIINRLS